MKQQERQTISHINSFNDEVSIYKVLFQDRTTTLLKKIVEQISNDRFDGNHTQYPSILLLGCSKRLVVEAMCNALCFNFEEVQGDLLGQGASLNTLYENLSKETLYHITSADKLTNYSVSFLYRFLNQGSILCRNPFTRENEMVLAMNKMFVFSATTAENMNADLLKIIDYHCHLDDYNNEQLRIIVEQRLNWCNIEYSEKVPALIVEHSQGSISNCINLLKVCYSIMRGDCRSKMIVLDVKKGLVLFLRQENDRQIRLLEK
jgi:Holliday junction resolvasome RuvABC ATP-dependent DNA helicase subunit